MAASTDSPTASTVDLPPAAGVAQKPSMITVTPAYSLISEKLRRVSAGSLQCSLFCGGHRCKYEVPNRWKDSDMALNGLFSHWVTDNVLAMARPSTFLFREHNLIEQFKRLAWETLITVNYYCNCVLIQ